MEREGKYPTLDRSDSLLGPDEDGDGVRDDIQAWILSLDLTDQQLRATLQFARAMQTVMSIDITEEPELRRARKEIVDSSVCYTDAYEDHVFSSQLSRKLQRYIANTRPRAQQYFNFNTALSGSVFRIPENPQCD
jgi:hypothetical protein